MADNTPQNVQDVDLGEAVRGLSGGQFVFNRYSLVKLLGRGRASAVWQAWDDKESRDVALKFLPGKVRQDAEAVADIKRTVEQLQKVNVPQVARIHGLEMEDKLMAVAMELVEGTAVHTLRSQKKNQVFDAVDLKEWLKQITKTLEKLHADAKVGHGNLKPTNFIVSTKGDVVITDAGINAKVGYWFNKLEGSPRDVSQSLRYCSPQQAKGQDATVTDDVYSLGIAIYELITSKPPFSTGNIMAQVSEDISPSMTRRRRDMRSLGEPIPRAWDETIAACLAKDPEKRPQTMAQVADLLELFGPSKTVLPSPAVADTKAAAAAAKPAVAIPGMQAPKPAGGKKNLVPIIAVVAGVALGIVGYFLSTQSSGPPTDTTFNTAGGTTVTKTNDPALEDLERKYKLEIEALQRKAVEEAKQAELERKRVELEKKKMEEELEMRKKALAASLAAAEKATQEAEAKRRAAEEEAKRNAAEAEAKKRLAEEKDKQLLAASDSIKKKEEELKAAAAKALQGGATKSAEAEAERKRIEQELATKRAELEKQLAEANKAKQEAEAKQRQAEEAAKLAAEQEKLRKENEAKALAAAEEEKKRLQEELQKKDAMDKRLADTDRARQLAEAEQRRKLEEARQREEMDRQMRLAKASEEVRKQAEAKRLAAEKAKKEAEAKLMAESAIVADRPGSAQVWHNSLGMRMVPLGDLQVCAWETRVQDFEAFVRETLYRAGKGEWKDPRIWPGHPAGGRFAH
jgi:hypothetical protein